MHTMDLSIEESTTQQATNKNENIRLCPEDPESKTELLSLEEQNGKIPTLFSISATILEGAVPTMIQLFSALFVNNTTLHFVGMMENTILFDGISLANNILTCFSFYIIFHMNIGLNAATSQAYGAHRYRLVGQYLHKALIIHLIMSLITYGFLYQSSHFLNLMGISPEISTITSRYLILCPGYVFGVIIFDTLKNYLYAHGIFNPQVICQTIISLSYWVLLDIFLFQFNMREDGIMLALTVTQIFGTFLLVIYIYLKKPQELKLTWFRFDKDSFRGLWGLFKIMVGVGVMGYIEVLAYKILAFVSVYFSDTQMAAFVTFLSFDDLYYVLPVGIAISLTTFIGNAVGSRDKIKVLRIIKATLFMGIGIPTMLLILFGIFKNQFFDFYTKDPKVKEILQHIAYVYYFFFVADFFQNIFAGILKGLGKESSGTKAFLISVYLIALPFSLLLAFWLKLEAVGMWVGVTFGVYFVLSCYIWIFIRTNFEEQSNYIAQRIKNTQTI